VQWARGISLESTGNLRFSFLKTFEICSLKSYEVPRSGIYEYFYLRVYMAKRPEARQTSIGFHDEIETMGIPMPCVDNLGKFRSIPF